ncbi:carbon-nitrogen hydrolase family protein [uncultured Amnibacterium sp.]|uniref:carbon-nitrogen hydrolase family protein n=1 Tax=uncultured Amnibacterium sp. TaxID=1631851 RepID=UPI0035CA7023
MTVTLAAAAASFGRDLDDNYRTIEALVAEATAQGADLLALPEAAIGGYLSSLGGPEDTSRPESLPPAIRVDGPELARVRSLAGDLVVVLGICEAAGPVDDPVRYNTVVALTRDRILGVHRKVHQPLGENMSYAAGETFAAFDSPVGRLGLMICYDKAFPEGARTLALDGAEVIVCVSAWPAARTAGATDLAEDRWTRRFRLFDQARALENQVIWVASNQAGTFHSLRFVSSAAVIGPGGDVLADTGVQAGLAVATVDVQQALATARRAMFHLRDRRPDAYDLSAVVAQEELTDA